MGKGDRRTRRGKVWRGTSGNVRPRTKAKPKSKSRPKSPRPAGKPAAPVQG